jgi:chemotaxis protein methyltransferase CheR
MVAADSFPDAIVTILGTDLSRDVIARAQEGVFTQLEVNRGLPAPMLIRHLERVGSRWRVRDDVRRRVRFQQMNLAKPWPALPRMDLVLLRNVLIYFDAPAKRAALAQVARVLSPPGLLLLGGAETTLGISPEWERRQVGRTTFYRPTAPVDAPWQQR